MSRLDDNVEVLKCEIEESVRELLGYDVSDNAVDALISKLNQDIDTWSADYI